eukprot:Gb_30595 [translate_table: standard]
MDGEETYCAQVKSETSRSAERKCHCECSTPRSNHQETHLLDIRAPDEEGLDVAFYALYVVASLPVKAGKIEKSPVQTPKGLGNWSIDSWKSKKALPNNGKTWLQSSQPMTRSQSSELQRRYVVMQGMPTQTGVEVLQRSVGRGTHNLKQETLSLSSFPHSVTGEQRIGMESALEEGRIDILRQGNPYSHWGSSCM